MSQAQRALGIKAKKLVDEDDDAKDKNNKGKDGVHKKDWRYGGASGGRGPLSSGSSSGMTNSKANRQAKDASEKAAEHALEKAEKDKALTLALDGKTKDNPLDYHSP